MRWEHLYTFSHLIHQIIQLNRLSPKSELKAMESEAQVLDLETLILAAFSTITPEDCQKWIKHAGIYV